MNINRKTVLLLLVMIAVGIIAVLVVVVILSRDDSKQGVDNTSGTDENNDVEVDPALAKAIDAGTKISNGRCSGSGPVELTALPMNEEDFSILIPYGLVIGGHVTPIDHQYFSPTVFRSARDTYNVMAPADGRIVDIGPRARTNPDNPSDKFTEYRIVFSYTCTFLTYFDLVTSLSPDLKAEYDKVKDSNGYANQIDFPVKSGQVIGKIGGQTLDFAVWDTEKPLTGFVVPEHYEGEIWKLYTANPNDYFSDDLVSILIAKNPRTVEPTEGKIDYDVDGKLIGNWFIKGSGGYSGQQSTGGGEYWKTHFSISPDHYDPTRYKFSIGDFDGEATQFLVNDKSFLPGNIGVDSGLQKIEVGRFEYTKPQGERWDNMSLIKGPKISANSNEPVHCALLQMTDARELKLETFKNKRCTSVTSFTANARVYER